MILCTLDRLKDPLWKLESSRELRIPELGSPNTSLIRILKVSMPDSIISTLFSHILIYRQREKFDFLIFNVLGILEQKVTLSKKYESQFSQKGQRIRSPFMSAVRDQLELVRRSFLVFNGDDLYICSSSWGMIFDSHQCNNLIDSSFSIINFLKDLEPSFKTSSDDLIKKDLSTTSSKNLQMIISTLGNPHFTYKDCSGSQFLFYFGAHRCSSSTEIGYCVFEMDVLSRIKSITKYIVPCCVSDKKKLDEQLSSSFI